MNINDLNQQKVLTQSYLFWHYTLFPFINYCVSFNAGKSNRIRTLNGWLKMLTLTSNIGLIKAYVTALSVILHIKGSEI